MACLNLENFLSKYPKGENAGQGGYGSVYLSGDFVVKEQEIFGGSFSTETSMMKQIDHPNICSIVDIAFDPENSIGYASMRRGIPLRKAFQDGLISVDEIISDLISALLFLSQHGIAHRDLKIENCIFLDDRLQLIDFGLSSFCYLFADGYCFKGVAYTYPYRDPECLFEDYTNIKSELYCIPAIIYYLTNNYTLDDYSRPRSFPTNGNEILELCQRFIDERPSVEELARHSSIITERILPGQLKNEMLPTVITEGLKEVFIVISDYCERKRYSSRVCFIALELARTLIQKNLAFQATTLCFLVHSIMDENYETKFQGAVAKVFAGDFCQIFNHLDGCIFRLTPWDQALSESDYSNSIKAMTMIGYDPSLELILPASTTLVSRNKSWVGNDLPYPNRNLALVQGDKLSKTILPLEYRGNAGYIDRPPALISRVYSSMPSVKVLAGSQKIDPLIIDTKLFVMIAYREKFSLLAPEVQDDMKKTLAVVQDRLFQEKLGF